MTSDAGPADGGQAGWREILGRQHRASLVIVGLGVWLHAADGLLVATMLPAIVAGIGGVSLMPWTIALYEIGSITAGAASGLMALRLGLRRPMALAALLFAAGCVLSALAPAMWVLLVGRLLQGFGGGGLAALSFVSVTRLFPPRLMGRVMAIISTVWGVSALTGPLIGGLFVELATWRLGFLCFALQAVLLAAWLMTRAEPATGDAGDARGQRFPAIRLLWLALGVVAVAYAGIRIGPLHTPAFVLAGLACLACFLWLDAAAPTGRLLPQHPIGLATPVGAALTMLLAFAAATIAIGVYVPFLLTSLHGVSPLVAGYLIALESIAWSVGATVVSGSPERRDGRMIVTGLGMVTLSILGLAWSVPFGPLWLVGASAILQGLGFGMAWTFILRRAAAVARPGEQALVAAAIPTVQRLGYALGAAYVGIVANAAGLEDDPTTLARTGLIVFLACLPLAAIGLVAAARFTRAEPGIA
ncbi:MAG: MFS transporter [Geminicoccaceae bacterium]